jgi:hypothetical protein
MYGNRLLVPIEKVVEAARELTEQALDLGGRQHLLEQDHVRAHDGSAARAARWDLHAFVVASRFAEGAACAQELVAVAVDVDHIVRASRAVQPVDVLREHHDLEALLELGDQPVRDARLRAAHRALDARDVLPGDVGATLKHGSAQGALDRHTVLGARVHVEPAHTAVGRQSRLSGQARTRDEQQATRARKPLADASGLAVQFGVLHVRKRLAGVRAGEAREWHPGSGRSVKPRTSARDARRAPFACATGNG